MDNTIAIRNAAIFEQRHFLLRSCSVAEVITILQLSLRQAQGAYVMA